MSEFEFPISNPDGQLLGYARADTVVLLDKNHQRVSNPVRPNIPLCQFLLTAVEAFHTWAHGCYTFTVSIPRELDNAFFAFLAKSPFDIPKRLTDTDEVTSRYELSYHLLESLITDPYEEGRETSDYIECVYDTDTDEWILVLEWSSGDAEDLGVVSKTTGN